MAEINHDNPDDLVAGMRSMVETVIKSDDLLCSKHPEHYEKD